MRHPLSGPSAQFLFYLHENALRLEVDGSNVMYEQMIALALAGAAPNLVVRVVPASAGVESYFGQDFVLFEFAKHQPLVYVGGSTTAMFIEDREYVTTYRDLSARLADVAAGAEESREFMAALADEYDRGSSPDDVDQLEEKHL